MSTTRPSGLRLLGKTVLITGASSGIGRALAMQLAEKYARGIHWAMQREDDPNFAIEIQGYLKKTPLQMILVARREDALRQLRDSIVDHILNRITIPDAVGLHVVPLDVRNRNAVRSFLERLPDEFRQIDVLVNNAGLVKGMDKVGDISDADIDTMFETNVRGLIGLTQSILPSMKERNKGDVVMVGSIAGRDPYPGGSIYCASKAAVRSFTDSLRREVIDTRIRVITVDPGQVETEFSLVRFNGDQAKAKAVYEGCEPLTPEDVAETIVFALTRRENVVIADTLVFPNHQAAATVMHRKT